MWIGGPPGQGQCCTIPSITCPVADLQRAGWIQSFNAELNTITYRWRRSPLSTDHLHITDHQFKLVISRKRHWLAVLNRFAILAYLFLRVCYRVSGASVKIINILFTFDHLSSDFTCLSFRGCVKRTFLIKSVSEAALPPPPPNELPRARLLHITFSLLPHQTYRATDGNLVCGCQLMRGEVREKWRDGLFFFFFTNLKGSSSLCRLWGRSQPKPSTLYSRQVKFCYRSGFSIICDKSSFSFSKVLSNIIPLNIRGEKKPVPKLKQLHQNCAIPPPPHKLGMMFTRSS